MFKITRSIWSDRAFRLFKVALVLGNPGDLVVKVNCLLVVDEQPLNRTHDKESLSFKLSFNIRIELGN